MIVIKSFEYKIKWSGNTVDLPVPNSNNSILKNARITVVYTVDAKENYKMLVMYIKSQ